MRLSIAAGVPGANASFFTHSSRFPHRSHPASTYGNSTELMNVIYISRMPCGKTPWGNREFARERPTRTFATRRSTMKLRVWLGSAAILLGLLGTLASTSNVGAQGKLAGSIKADGSSTVFLISEAMAARSEERRVGKEC